MQHCKRNLEHAENSSRRTSHVKKERIDMGVKKFETFKMKKNETLDEIFARLTIIVNELRSLGKPTILMKE